MPENEVPYWMQMYKKIDRLHFLLLLLVVLLVIAIIFQFVGFSYMRYILSMIPKG